MGSSSAEDSMNVSLGASIDYDLYQKYNRNRAVSDPTYWTLIVAYSILIILGSFGNLFVIMAVVKNKAMRTARNIFIATLAVADSTLCLITMPMTLLGILTKYWPFGPQTWLLCKIVRSCPAITVFFSSYTMAVIAIDRHRFIVHSSKRQVSGKEAVWISVAVFALSVLISIPFVIVTKLHPMFEDDPGEFDHIAFCVEDLPQIGQALLSFSVIIFQYLVPCAVVTVCYVAISRYLASRPILASDQRQKEIIAKRKRNNRMLITVSVTHFMSWLPLNIVNLVITTFDSANKPLFHNIEHLFITYAICHLASMTSAISNPVLYGFMNENFRQEFEDIFNSVKDCFKPRHNTNNNINGVDSPINAVTTAAAPGETIPLTSINEKTDKRVSINV